MRTPKHKNMRKKTNGRLQALLMLLLLFALTFSMFPASMSIAASVEGNSANVTDDTGVGTMAPPYKDNEDGPQSEAPVFTSGEGTLTIAADRGSFTVYALFYGEINLASGMRNYSWALESTPDEFWMYVQRTVTDDYYYDITKREDLAEWMLDEYENNPEELAVRLARIAQEHATPVKEDIQRGDSVSLPSGYYLVESTEAHPVFVFVAPNTTTEIYAKDSTPTVSKKVMVAGDDGQMTSAEFVDMKVGVPIAFRLVGTLSSNYETFERYFYKFSDRQSEMLVLRTDTVRVTLIGEDGTVKQDLTSAADITYDESAHIMTVTFDALRKSAPSAVHTDIVQVDYEGYLAKSAPNGINSPSLNSASIEFSPSPTNEWGVASDLITPMCTTNIYTFSLNVRKVDRADTNKTLSGASFAIRDVDEDKYLADDGFWRSGRPEDYAYDTDADGLLTLNGISEGNYELIEVGHPDGYMLLARTIEFCVETDVEAEKPVMTVETESVDAVLESVDVNTGKIAIRVMNDQELPIPLTGAALPIFLIITLLVILITVCVMVRTYCKRHAC